VTPAGIYQNIGNVEINNADQIAFYAERLTGAQGIYTGPDPVANRVIQGGDAIFGTTLSTVTFFGGGLNDSGQVAFFARLVNATPQSGGWNEVVVLATPVPEPAIGCAITLVSLTCISRRRSRNESWRDFCRTQP
jgi:hypothetical protein